MSVPIASSRPQLDRLVDRCGDARVDDQLSGAVDEFEVDVGPSGRDRIEHCRLQVESERVIEVAQHHVVAMQEHRTGGDQTIAGGEFDVVDRLADLQPVQ